MLKKRPRATPLPARGARVAHISGVVGTLDALTTDTRGAAIAFVVSKENGWPVRHAFPHAQLSEQAAPASTAKFIPRARKC